MAKKNNYFENVAGEINDVYQAYRKRTEASQQPGPGTDARANKLAGYERREAGQLVGAILMGARYDTKGNRISGETQPYKKVKK